MPTEGGLLHTQRESLKRRIRANLEVIAKSFQEFPNLKSMLKILDLEELKEMAIITGYLVQGSGAVNASRGVEKEISEEEHAKSKDITEPRDIESNNMESADSARNSQDG